MFTGRGTVGPKAEVVDREGTSEAYDGKETAGANSVLMGKQMRDCRSAALSRTDIFQGLIRFEMVFRDGYSEIYLAINP